MASAIRRLSVIQHDKDEGKTWPAIAIGLFVAFGGILYGYDVLPSLLVLPC
jgi:MFS transporter, SP family, sugar:H+ symporter